MGQLLSRRSNANIEYQPLPDEEVDIPDSESCGLKLADGEQCRASSRDQVVAITSDERQSRSTVLMLLDKPQTNPASILATPLVEAIPHDSTIVTHVARLNGSNRAWTASRINSWEKENAQNATNKLEEGEQEIYGSEKRNEKLLIDFYPSSSCLNEKCSTESCQSESCDNDIITPSARKHAHEECDSVCSDPLSSGSPKPQIQQSQSSFL